MPAEAGYPIIFLIFTNRVLYLVIRPSYSDAFVQTEDGGRKTTPAFVLRLPSPAQGVKLARKEY
jgi:hypothetical protein